MTTMEQCRMFYEEHGAPMLRRLFPEYEAKIAVGIAGEGSDCFGYDDVISQDHDYAIGFCMWLTDEDYEAIGETLKRAYCELIEKRGANTSRLDYRRGPVRIRDYYQRILEQSFDMDTPALTQEQWYRIDEWRLATAVNGQVFCDELGKFTKIRQMLLGYYPDRIWKMRLVNALHSYASTAQANYARCMARGDAVAAALCKMKGLEAAMELAFLLRRTYAPYYKWTFRALGDLEGSGELAKLLRQAAETEMQDAAWENFRYCSNQINQADSLVLIFEQIAELILEELHRLGLTNSNNLFLEAHCGIIASMLQI